MAEQNEKVISVKVEGVDKALANLQKVEDTAAAIRQELVRTGKSLPEAEIRRMAKEIANADVQAKKLGRSLKEAFRNVGKESLGSAGIAGGVAGLFGGFIGGGVATLIDKATSALYEWITAESDAEKEARELKEANDEVTKSFTQEIVVLDTTYEALTNVNNSSEERQAALDRLQETYPDYFDNINLEKSSLEDIKKAYDDVINSIDRKIRAQVLESRAIKAYNDQLDAETKLNELLDRQAKNAQSQVERGIISREDLIEVNGRLITQAQHQSEGFRDLSEEVTAATNKYKALKDEISSLPGGVTDGTGGTGGKGGSSAGAKSTVKALIFDIENLTQAITAAERAIGTGAANEELEILIKIVEAKRDAAIADNAAALASQNLSGRTKEELEEEIALQNRLSLEYAAQLKEIAELRLQQQKNFLATTGEIKTISDLTKGSDFRDAFNRPIKEQKKIIEELVRSSESAMEFVSGLSEKGIYLVGTEDIIDKGTQATRTIRALQDELKALNELQTKGIVTEAEIRAKAAKAINDLGDELSKRREESDKVITTFILEEPEKLAAILEEAGVTSFEIVRRNLLDQATSVLETSLNVIRQSIEELREAFPGESIFAGSPDEGGLTLLPDFAKKFPVEAERIKTLMTTWNTEITLIFDTHRKRLEGIDTEAWDTIIKNASKASKDQIRQLKADQKAYEIEFEELYRRLYKLDKENTDRKRKANEDFNQEDIDEVKRHIQQLLDIKNAETAAELEAEVDKYIKLIELQKGNADEQIILLKELESKRKEIINANQKTNEEVIERFSELLDSETEKVREGFSNYFSGLQSAISTTNEAIDNLFQFLLNEQQFVIDDLIAEVTKIEGLVQDTQSRINELEDDLEGKRSGRREAILRAIESEKDAEERLLERKLELQAKLLKEEEKMAKKRKAFAISQALINGALASMNIWANNTIPYPAALAFNIPMQVAIAALTATQVALIAQQKFAKGGYTGSGRGGDRDETGHIPVGVVHNDEYVVPKWMVKSPKYRPIIDNLESARKRGFAEGGYTSPDFAALSDSVSPNSNNRVYSLVQRSVDAAIALSERPVIANPVEFTNVERTVARRVQATTIGG